MSEVPISFGWLADASVADLVLDHREVFADLPFVLIAAIDSAKEVSAMKWAHALSQESPELFLCSDPVVVTGETLCRLVDDGRFTGFDEIWVPRECSTDGPPTEVYLTAPLQLSVAVPIPLDDWFRGSGWRLGLGDGFGLNYISSDRVLSLALGLIEE